MCGSPTDEMDVLLGLMPCNVASVLRHQLSDPSFHVMLGDQAYQFWGILANLGTRASAHLMHWRRGLLLFVGPIRCHLTADQRVTNASKASIFLASRLCLGPSADLSIHGWNRWMPSYRETNACQGTVHRNDGFDAKKS